MIVLSRATARSFRAVLRRSVLAAAPRGPAPPILAVAEGGGLVLHAAHADVGLTLHVPQSTESFEQMAFPGELLARFEGTADTPVVLELLAPDQGRARWEDKRVPQVVEFTPVAVDQLSQRCDIPKRLAVLPPTFLQVLDDLCRTTERNPTRFALGHVQLRGKAGQLVASDGRQMLLLGGFRLPFTENVLVPALPVFGARELAGADAVRLGRAEQWLVVQAGAWSVHLKINSNGRFPDVLKVIPAGPAPTCLLLDEADAEFLLGALPGLPGADEQQAPITLDLDQQALLRAQGEKAQTEVLLAGSRVTGTPLRFCLDRKFLFRALRLGFRIFELQPPKMMIARDGDRLFVCAMLDPKGAVAPSPDCVRFSSNPALVVNNHRTYEREEVMSNVNNGRAPEQAPLPDPLEEAEALRSALQEALNRSTRLIVALRHFRKHQKAVTSAVASLQQLRLAP